MKLGQLTAPCACLCSQKPVQAGGAGGRGAAPTALPCLALRLLCAQTPLQTRGCKCSSHLQVHSQGSGYRNSHPQRHCHSQVLTEPPQQLTDPSRHRDSCEICIFTPFKHYFLLPSPPPRLACGGKALRNKTISNAIKDRLVGVCLLGFPSLLLLSQRINIREGSGVI